jgi:hypothetical protein
MTRDTFDKTWPSPTESDRHPNEPGADRSEPAFPQSRVTSIVSVDLDEWPPPLESIAFRGVAGDVVGMIEPHTESDPAALLLQFLVAFGSCIGRSGHAVAEADRHGTNLFVVCVGASSKGRKGTSWGHIRRLFKFVDDEWVDQHVVPGGLSSGEGLVYAVRDASQAENDEGEPLDPGVDDKRLLAYESEFASVLRMLERTGNTLSETVRQAWDTGTFRSLTKTNATQATDAHISIVGHVTRDELLRYLTSTESSNGFGNRFLWCAVRRSKVLPFGGNLGESAVQQCARVVFAAAKHARARWQPLVRTPAARDLWRDIYGDLSEGRPGLLGSILGRAEAQVLRLSVVYALLDRANIVELDHLQSALAVWRYCEDSARWIFGDALGDPIADECLRLLRERSSITRTAIRDHFGRHGSHKVDKALALLERSGLARKETRRTGGRPAEVWSAIEATKATQATQAAHAGYPNRASVASVASVASDDRPPWERDP